MAKSSKKPAVAKSKKDAAVEAVNAWADAPETSTYDPALHEAVGRFLLRAASRPTSVLDAFSIPMA